MLLKSEELKQAKVDMAKRDFCKVIITRVPEGISLYIKSEAIEQFMRSATPAPAESLDARVAGTRNILHTPANPGWKDKFGYLYPLHPRFENNFKFWGYNLFPYNNPDQGINMSFLLAKDLKEGLTWTLPGLYTDTSIKKFKEEFRKQIIDLYRDFLKPFGEELSITYEEIG